MAADNDRNANRRLISRRWFVGGAAAAGATAMSGAITACWRTGDGTNAAPAAPTPTSPATAAVPSSIVAPPTSRPIVAPAVSQPVLVLVTLYGGNDGLNTLIPYQDSVYLAGRPQLGYAPEQVLALDAELGLHPSLAGCKQLWDQQRLAIVRGVGYPQANRSHFRSMDIWQSAVVERDERTGWLGRWLDLQAADPMAALAIGATVPHALVGSTTTASAVSGSLTLPGGPTLGQGFEKLVAAANDPARGPLAERVITSSSALLQVQRDLTAALDTAPVADGATLEGGGTENGDPNGDDGASQRRNSSDNPLATQLDTVADAIAGGAPTRVYAVSLGGFDTHAAQRDTHTALLAQLDAALIGFVGRIDALNPAPDVSVVVYSEFGRRVAENGSGGTDHGTAAPVFVVGPRVNAGYIGEQPSLTALDDGDLIFTVDFRSVYAAVLADVLSADPSAVLGTTVAPIDLFR